MGTQKSYYALIFTVFLLVIFGLVMISSASVVSSRNDFDDAYYYLKHQIFNGLIPGLIGFFVLQKISYQRLKKWIMPLFVINLILLVLVFFPSIAGHYGGAKSWLRFGSVTFQPSEMMKLVFILYLASWFSSRQNAMKDFNQTFLPFAIVLGMISLLLIMQPDIGTLGLIVLPAIVMYFLAGGSLKYIALILGSGVAGLFMLVKIAPYRLERLLVFLNPQVDPLGIGYQINQALLAVGSGGVFGLGLGHSRQKFNYLPEAQGDSIFAIIGEELGLVGAVMLVGVFIWLTLQCFKIARDTSDSFGRFIIYGVSSWIIIQTFINIGANLSLLPLTGVPLPFISYGGTALAIEMAAMGVIVNIAKEA